MLGSAVADVEIDGNYFYNYAGALDGTKGDEALLIDALAGFENADRAPITFRRNRVSGVYRNGMAVTNGINLDISYNTFINCGNAGIDFEPYLDGFVINNCKVSHNKVY